MDKELFDSFVDLQEDKVLKIVNNKIKSGKDLSSIAETCRNVFCNRKIYIKRFTKNA